MAVEFPNRMLAVGTVTPFINPTIQAGFGLMRSGVRNGVGDVDVLFDPEYLDAGGLGSTSIQVYAVSIFGLPAALWVDRGQGAAPNSRQFLFTDGLGVPVDITSFRIAVFDIPLTGYFF